MSYPGKSFVIMAIGIRSWTHYGLPNLNEPNQPSGAMFSKPLLGDADTLKTPTPTRVGTRKSHLAHLGI